MIIAFFGITYIGKITIGRIVADELRYSFYDLDAEMKILYNDTIIFMCFIRRYKRAFERIKRKYDLVGKAASEAVRKIIETIIRPCYLVNR